MEGIEKLKSLLAFPMSLHMAYDKAKSDGSINFQDAPLLLDPVMKLMPMLAAVGGVIPELKDLSDAEKDSLYAWAKANYDIADDQVEAKIEKGLAVVLHVAQFLGQL